MQGNVIKPRLVLRTHQFQRMMRARGCETASAQAALLGVTVSTVTRVCSGHVQPSGAFVARACDVLDVGLAELFEVIPASVGSVA